MLMFKLEPGLGQSCENFTFEAWGTLNAVGVPLDNQRHKLLVLFARSFSEHFLFVFEWIRNVKHRVKLFSCNFWRPSEARTGSQVHAIEQNFATHVRWTARPSVRKLSLYGERSVWPQQIWQFHLEKENNGKVTQTKKNSKEYFIFPEVKSIRLLRDRFVPEWLRRKYPSSIICFGYFWNKFPVVSVRILCSYFQKEVLIERKQCVVRWLPTCCCSWEQKLTGNFFSGFWRQNTEPGKTNMCYCYDEHVLWCPDKMYHLRNRYIHFKQRKKLSRCANQQQEVAMKPLPAQLKDQGVSTPSLSSDERQRCAQLHVADIWQPLEFYEYLHRVFM